ncbi:hypothetical protein [Flavobacterium capsici]|uniref:DUF4369 domain-containing protein n=1 Tax=Flavobacterium capsici TaxID=3075618 RepID=A0AA96EYA1_9FLAO|nr:MULTISPECIES: hypothetical protein [unclassified Flavobacterium]WNM19210.1 hypothetical protein RN608_00665 [Flavobacterium sp. PMR2A8]WNM20599.1 hypothetical protein RN605_07835 [Flavobacterium sp. PMTSA4]
MKFKLLCLSLVCTFFVQAQDDELYFLKGRIVSQIKELNEIYVTNSRSESAAATNGSGDFSLFVKVGDTLKFSGLQIVPKKMVLSSNDVVKTLLVVALQPKVFELSEVKVNDHPEINAVSLGILQKPAKKYTPAERRLKTATSLDGAIGFGGVMSLDPLINWISGRTAMLKKELEVEKHERLKKKIENYFGEDYFISTLKIPAEYVNGFLFYAVEDEKLVQVASENNKSLMQFQLGEIAVKYLELISQKE